MANLHLSFASLLALCSVLGLVLLLRSRMPGWFTAEPEQLKKVSLNYNPNGTDGDLESEVIAKELIDSIEEADISSDRKKSSSLQRMFKYAQWDMSPSLFRVFEIAISAFALGVISIFFGIILQIFALFVGPIVMGSLLRRAVAKRAKLFDRDYAQFIMQVVGLLKTGMTPTAAIQAAASSLEPESLVRAEVRMMLERVKYGIPEDRSIGAFAEDIDHPEIELFVQALLLSRRLGGNLSDTLERLAKQVRKRQHFKESAEAAIGLQRGSLWIIVALLIGVEGYIGVMYPELITKAIAMDIGWMVWQGCILLIICGFLWIRQVTNIKI